MKVETKKSEKAMGILCFFDFLEISHPSVIDSSLKTDQFWSPMKTCSLSKAKGVLGKLADQALKGQPTVIPRGGKLVILQAYELPDHPDEFDSLIQAGKNSRHRPLTRKVLKDIWQRGRAGAKKS
jgi:hypothetical protein